MLILKESTIDNLQKEKCRELGKEMIPRIKKLAEIYYRKLKIDEFWMMITGKPDLFTGKIMISVSAYDKKNRPDFFLMSSQMWHIKWSSGLCELEWILPLKKQGEHYTKDDPFVKKSLQKAEKYFNAPLVSKENHMSQEDYQEILQANN